MKEILIWSDYVCPFCYIGEKRLKDAIKDLGLEKEVKISYRAFELNKNAPKETTLTIPELIAKKYSISLEEAKKRVQQIDEMGKDLNLDFRYATAKSCNTLDAHRLMRLAEDRYGEKVAETLNELLFIAYFTDNRNIADHDVLMQLGVNAGMKTEEMSEILNSKHYTESVRRDENTAEALGVRGVPYMVFDNKLAVPGAISTEDFKNVLKEIIGSGNEKNSLKTVQNCNEEGCSI